MNPYHLEPGASQGNAFTRHLDGQPSIFCNQSRKDHGAAVSAAIQAKRIAGARVPETPMFNRVEDSPQQVAYSRAGK